GDNQHRTLLAIRYPDGTGAGTRVADPVRTVDIVPTLVERLELEWPNDFDGKTMANLIAGEREDPVRPLYVETGMTERRYWNSGHASYPWEGVGRKYRVDAETGLVHIRPEFHEYLLGAKDRAYQQGNWKLVWRPMKSGPALVQLFNRAEDPVNRNDISLQHPEAVARLGLEMATILARDGVGEPRALEWADLLDVSLDEQVAQLAEEARKLHARQAANKGRQDESKLSPAAAAAEAGKDILPTSTEKGPGTVVRPGTVPILRRPTMTDSRHAGGESG
ncbi:MAG: hypothetical protein VX265_02245, partial [Myxococcota bacterium]|nr:hypothetical protein [Myxococcota bacterium]